MSYWDLVDTDAVIQYSERPLDLWLQKSEVRPGEMFQFAWMVRSTRSDIATWRNATLDLFDDASGIRLWTRSFAWPRTDAVPAEWISWEGEVPSQHPVYHDRPATAWPPSNSFFESPAMFSDPGRTALYSGFEQRVLRVRLSGSSGDPLEATALIQIIPEGITSAWAALQISGIAPPARIPINTAYDVQAQLTNFGQCRTTAEITLIRNDLSTTNGNERLPATSPAELTTSQTAQIAVFHEAPENWSWVFKPAYEIEPSETLHTITYVIEAVWQDEFGNRYEPVHSPEGEALIFVTQQKIAAANAANVAFDAEAGFSKATVFGAIVAPFGPIGAAIGAIFGAIGAAGTFFSAEAHDGFGQIADDPPEPSKQYWSVLPPPTAADLSAGSAPQPFAVSALLAKAILDVSETRGRLLGARLWRVPAAENLQRAHLETLSKTIGDLTAQLVGESVRAVEALHKIDLDTFRAALGKARQDPAFEKEVRARLANQSRAEVDALIAQSKKPLPDPRLLVTRHAVWAQHCAEGTLDEVQSWLSERVGAA